MILLFGNYVNDDAIKMHLYKLLILSTKRHLRHSAAVGAFVIFSSAGAQVAGRKLPIYCVDRDDNKIALTFDVAWENFKTEQLIDIIDEFDDSLITTVEGIEMKVIRWHLIQMENRSTSHFKGLWSGYFYLRKITKKSHDYLYQYGKAYKTVSNSKLP